MKIFMITILVIVFVLENCVATNYWLPYSSNSRRFVRDSSCKEEKVWLFAANEFTPALSFIDQSTGEITGPDPDLIKSVCEIAKKRCEVLFLSESQADHVCVASDEQTGNNIFGTGLQGGLIDACVGWGNSLSRKTFFDFTTPQIRSVSGVLFVRKADAAGFDPAGKTIIVVAHEVFDAFCYKQISGVTNVKFIVAESKAAAVEKLIALEGDAIFTSVIGPQAVHPSIEKLSTPFKCSEGFAMIVKRGSSLPCWWDRAFQEYKTSGRYKTEYCAAVADKLGQLVGAPVTEEFVCFLDDI